MLLGQTIAVANWRRRISWLIWRFWFLTTIAELKTSETAPASRWLPNSTWQSINVVYGSAINKWTKLSNFPIELHLKSQKIFTFRSKVDTHKTSNSTHSTDYRGWNRQLKMFANHSYERCAKIDGDSVWLPAVWVIYGRYCMRFLSCKW